MQALLLTAALVASLLIGVSATGAGEKPVIYLTYDDGPHPQYTEELLDVLDEYDATVTFFVLGRGVARHRSEVVDAHARGHSIQNHTHSHPRLTTLSDAEIRAEIRSTDELIESVTGYTPSCVRPPLGITDGRVEGVINGLDRSQKLWDVSAHDWSEPGIETIANRIISQTSSGSVVLLHDGPFSEDRSQTIAATRLILEHFSDLGFEFRALPGCNSAGPVGPVGPAEPFEPVEVVDLGEPAGDGSLLTVLANGATGEERLELSIDGVVVDEFRLPLAAQFWSERNRWGSFQYRHDGELDPGQVRLRFVNDGQTASGADRNVRVDAIAIDGVRYETEAAGVYSTGSWSSTARCRVGYHKLDNLSCGGYLQYASTEPPAAAEPAENVEPVEVAQPPERSEPRELEEPVDDSEPDGAVLEVLAAGSTGEETLVISVDGVLLTDARLSAAAHFWNGSVSWQKLVYELDPGADPTVVRVAFANDGRSSSGRDRDVRVDAIAIDGVRYETEAAGVYSTGSWSATARCRGGYHQLDNLACEGYVEFQIRN